MLTQIILDSFLFWLVLSAIMFAAIWITRVAIRMHEYEQQVNRGWDDLIARADKMIAELKELNTKQKPRQTRKQ